MAALVSTRLAHLGLEREFVKAAVRDYATPRKREEFATFGREIQNLFTPGAVVSDWRHELRVTLQTRAAGYCNDAEVMQVYRTYLQQRGKKLEALPEEEMSRRLSRGAPKAPVIADEVAALPVRTESDFLYALENLWRMAEEQCLFSIEDEHPPVSAFLEATRKKIVRCPLHKREELCAELARAEGDLRSLSHEALYAYLIEKRAVESARDENGLSESQQRALLFSDHGIAIARNRVVLSLYRRGFLSFDKLLRLGSDAHRLYFVEALHEVIESGKIVVDETFFALEPQQLLSLVIFQEEIIRGRRAPESVSEWNREKCSSRDWSPVHPIVFRFLKGFPITEEHAKKLPPLQARMLVAHRHRFSGSLEKVITLTRGEKDSALLVKTSEGLHLLGASYSLVAAVERVLKPQLEATDLEPLDGVSLLVLELLFKVVERNPDTPLSFSKAACIDVITIENLLECPERLALFADWIEKNRDQAIENCAVHVAKMSQEEVVRVRLAWPLIKRDIITVNGVKKVFVEVIREWLEIIDRMPRFLKTCWHCKDEMGKTVHLFRHAGGFCLIGLEGLVARLLLLSLSADAAIEETRGLIMDCMQMGEERAQLLLNYPKILPALTPLERRELSEDELQARTVRSGGGR